MTWRQKRSAFVKFERVKNGHKTSKKHQVPVPPWGSLKAEQVHFSTDGADCTKQRHRQGAREMDSRKKNTTINNGETLRDSLG